MVSSTIIVKQQHCVDSAVQEEAKDCLTMLPSLYHGIICVYDDDLEVYKKWLANVIKPLWKPPESSFY